MSLTTAEQLEKLQQQQKSINDKITKIKQRQVQYIGKLAIKHNLTDWDEQTLDKAFSFIKETGKDQFVEKEKNKTE